MKKLINVQEVEGEGLEALLGEKVTIFCMNYIYTGKLIGVNKTCVLLEDPAIVYSTGDFASKVYSDVQSLQVKTFYVQTSSIESFGVLK
jgi:hypothetical protein